MLFDLQSRRRRTVVKVIYLLLAVLMASGLILFGVGAGNGNGGFLNSLSGSGSGGNSLQNSLVSKGLKSAEATVKADPGSAAAWQALMQARYQVAGSGSNYDQTTNTFTASGKVQLQGVLAAWTRYAALVKGQTDQSTTLLAARAYSATQDFSGATVAWQDFIAGAPGELRGYECLALTAYAAKKTNLGDEAAAKAVQLTPKLNRLTTKQALAQAKSSPSTATSAAAVEC